MFDYVLNASDRLALEQGCYFDEAKGMRPIHFIEKFCRQSKGRWAGQPLTLMDWQRSFIMRLFGWRAPDGKRRFRTVYLEVGKKNGKSTMISAPRALPGTGRQGRCTRGLPERRGPGTSLDRVRRDGADG